MLLKRYAAIFKNLDARIQRSKDGETDLNMANGSVERGVKSMLYAAREILNVSLC
jgi:hypothetical protein